MPRLSTDAVLGQGGSDDYGIVQAFEQAGGPYAEKLPVIEGGGSSDFVIWWNKKGADTYKTTSMNTTPGIGGAAFWLAYDIVKGAKPAMRAGPFSRWARPISCSRWVPWCSAAR